MNEFFAFIVGLVSIVLPGFGQPATQIWNGYVEADYSYAAAPSPGTIETLPVHEGQIVQAGAVLFTLSATQQQALAAAADAQIAAAQANLDNLQTGGRTEEIDVIRATLRKAESDLTLAQQSAARAEKLFAQGLTPQSGLDQARAARDSATAQVSQLRAQLKVAELPARDAQQIAAEANLVAARANAEKAAADLSDRTVIANEAGRIERIYFRNGEMAGAGTPVLSLLGTDALKIKFYVNEADRDLFKLGDTIVVSCDGCPDGLTASVNHFASDPQFTPPIIYSRDERSRLVFLTEAVLANDAAIHPGQPVTIRRAK